MHSTCEIDAKKSHRKSSKREMHPVSTCDDLFCFQKDDVKSKWKNRGSTRAPNSGNKMKRIIWKSIEITNPQPDNF